jgi:hypothetical protein
VPVTVAVNEDWAPVLRVSTAGLTVTEVMVGAEGLLEVAETVVKV